MIKEHAQPVAPGTHEYIARVSLDLDAPFFGFVLFAPDRPAIRCSGFETRHDAAQAMVSMLTYLINAEDA